MFRGRVRLPFPGSGVPGGEISSWQIFLEWSGLASLSNLGTSTHFFPFFACQTRKLMIA